MKLAEAYVELNQRGFRGVQGAIGRIRSSMGGLLSFASGPFAAGLAAVGAGASIAGMVKLSAQAEQTRVQFQTLLGDVNAAKQAVDDLRQFSASTPFQFAGLADAAKTLLAFGTANEQVIPTMQILGDVAAATGNSVNELAGIYGKVRARGALMTEQLDQFNERGIPIGERLAETFGVTGAEIREMASSGQISFADLQRAMQGMASEGGMAFEGMEAQSQTLSGVFSTFKDNVAIVLTDVGDAIVEGFDLTSVTAGMTSFVQRVRNEYLPAVIVGFRWMSENIVKPVYSAVSQMIDAGFDFVTNWQEYMGLVQDLAANTFANLVETIHTHMQNGVNLSKWFATSTVQFFANIYSNGTEIFGSLVDQIKELWQSVLNFFKTGTLEFDFSPMADAFNAAVEGIAPPELMTPELQSNMDLIRQFAVDYAQRQADRESARNDAYEQEAFEIDELSNKERQRDEEKERRRRQASGFSELAALADQMQAESLTAAQERGGGAGAVGDQAGMAMQATAEQKAQVAAVQQQNAALQQIVALATGQGLRVVMSEQGGITLPEASIQFGG